MATATAVIRWVAPLPWRILLCLKGNVSWKSCNRRSNISPGDCSGLEDLPNVREIRRAGFIAGIEVAQRNGGSFDGRDQVGAQVCLAARRYGLLTRPIRDVIVLMLPLCVTCEEIDLAIDAIEKAVTEVCDRAG